ncbi:MAG: hypothetical protein V1729_01730 [Candidatus Woesearchaeota archaeon]
MRKISALFIITMLVVLLFAVGCAKEEKPTRTLVSRSTDAKPAAEEPMATVAETEKPAVVKTAPSKSSLASGARADCEQLSNSEISGVFAGSWTKSSDCPKRPAMPSGVDVCMCTYEGPGQLYVNVETQLYADEAEAIRVFKMYCADEENEVGDMSCRRVRSSSLTPNFVYFLSGNTFVKVSCLGGSCPLDAVAELAKQVEAEI